MKSEDKGFRMSDGGLEPVGANGREKPRSTGFGDKKKVAFLVALLAVGGGVAAYQILKGGSPQVAVARPAESPGAGAIGPMAGVRAEAAAATAALATPADSDDGLSVARVEQLVKEFESYVTARQTPAKNLQANPFTVCPVKVKKVEGRPLPQSDAAYEEVSVRRQKLRETAGGLVLGSVMVAADRRMAVINGKVCTVGSRVKGFVVEAIDPDLVRVSADGDTVDLRLVRKQAQQPD